MQSKMPDCCAAANCNVNQKSDQSDVAFFSFPLDPERCKQWLNNCQRPDLGTKTPEELHQSYKLCAKHFDSSLLCQEGDAKAVLKDGAIPTIFDIKSKPEPQTYRRKRPGEPISGEPDAVKKSKDGDIDEPNVEDNSEAGENSAASESMQDDLEAKEDPHAKGKEILKLYFKETLALTGFSIGNNTSLSVAGPMGGQGTQLKAYRLCDDKVDKKEVMKFGEDLMREEIQNSLRHARFFSILLQDVILVEGKEQLPVFIRTVTDIGFPQKHLIGFLPCDVDCESLFYMLLSEIRNKWCLRMEHCRGLTYLTTGAICQKMKELSTRILRDFPQVVLAPSDPYAFNMWLIRSMPMLSIQNVMSAVEEVASLLREVPLLWTELEWQIFATYGHIKGEVERIKDSCQGNWEYGINAFQTMLDILEPLLTSMAGTSMKVELESKPDTAKQVAKLIQTLKNFNVIMTLVVLKNTLCCVSILNPSLRGTISISSTLQYTISNALKLLNKYLQEIAIHHRKWFSDAVGRAKKLGVTVAMPEDAAENSQNAVESQASLEDYYRESLCRKVLLYLVDEVKRVFSTEMVRILRWLSLVPSYMADHNFSIRRDKVADANLNNLSRPDTFYDELGCWEVKWRHASKKRILPTTVFATLKIPDIGFYPNVQSLLRVLGTIPCVNAEADVYGQYDMVLDRYHAYMRETPKDQRLCNAAFVYVNQDVHMNMEAMVESYIEKHPDILQLLETDNEAMETECSAPENDVHGDGEETQMVLSTTDVEKPRQADCSETNKEALKSALQSAVTAAFSSQHKRSKAVTDESESGTEYVSKSEMKEVLRVCEDAVREGILSEVGNSFFSLFIDRVVRMGEVDYLPLFLRFVDSFDVMRLELLGFVEADLDCETMSRRLFDLVTEWQLDLKYCRGQAYLGSGEVSYKLKAFACKVQEKHPLAISSYSSCYAFNTWWSRSIPVSSITRALDVLEEVMLYFGSTPALEKQLDQVIGVGLRESFEKIHELQGKFCAVWMEKHDCYEVFVQMLEPLVECLEKIHLNKPQRWKVAESSKAGLLLRLLQDFDFIMPMVALKNASSFTRELSAGLQKDHFSAASQLCQINGIVATLNRVKTNIKVFHQNWFEEACALAQSLRVQIKLPDSAAASRDGMVKPATYYKEMLSMPLVDNLINAVKDHFSDDHKEALNFLSLVPCSVTVSYMFEILKSKPPLYINDLPDPDNFSTELSCWRVKWKTKMVAVTIPDTIFQTLRLPVMQYFANIATLLRIMCVLPSTALEFCGETTSHSKYQDYLKNTLSTDRTPCLAMLQVGTNFNRDLDRMVAQCLKITPKTLEGICLDQESKTILKNSEMNSAVEYNTEDGEEFDNKCTANVKDEPGVQAIDTNGHSGDNRMSARRLFQQAARLARKGTLLSSLPKEDQDALAEELSLCHWSPADKGSTVTNQEFLDGIVKSIREAILEEVQDSPFFSIITDKVVTVSLKRYLPVYVRYVGDYTPKVELLGFLPLSDNCQGDSQAKFLSQMLTDDWGLNMSYCRGQAYLRSGPESQSLRKLSMEFLESYPLAVVTPSESCGLAHWLSGSLQCDHVLRLLGIVEDLLQFFDQSPTLESKLAETVDRLLNTPREAFDESPETCCSRWRKREDFFDSLVDTLEGILSCLDSVSANSDGIWSSTMALHAAILSTAIRGTEFVVTLVILKNACAPLKNCSTVFRCGNPADIVCELEKIPLITDSLSSMLANIDSLHTLWFDQAIQLVTKVSGLVIFPEMAGLAQSPEIHYRETITLPVLTGLIEEMKYNFTDDHLKALKVLSLLPTCGPLPVVPESPDQLHVIFQDELPEPDTSEQDLNSWAMAWREKYQDVSPPASISETLLHIESKSNLNVTTLLKRVAVLPNVSMECDLMKMSLNSVRGLLRNTVCRGSRTDTVMLLSHQPVFLLLEEIIDKCIEGEPESRTYLTKVKQTVDEFKMKIELTPVETNGSCKPDMDVREEKPDVKVREEKPDVKMETDSENSVAQRPVFSFYSQSVREEIIKELWESRYFTVIIEQDVEIDSAQHVPICIRYLDQQETQCEETLALIPVTMDIKAFVDSLETVLSEKWGLNIAFCRGLSLLCTGSAGQQLKLAVTLFSQRYPQVICTLSSAISLNAWLMRTSFVAIMGTRGRLLEELLHWFTADIHRQTRLEDAIMFLFSQDEAKGNELRDKLNCEHWERGHDMLDFMVDILEAITLCLGEMRHGTSGQEKKDVLRFNQEIQDFRFIFTLVALKNILGITKTISQGLQGKPLDMLHAVNNLPILPTKLSELKTNLDSCHQIWFTESVALASKLQIHLLHPALLESLSWHYQETISLPAVDRINTEVGELFPNHVMDAMRCLQVVPYVLSKTEDSCVDVGLVSMFKQDLPDMASFSDEAQKWKAKWTDSMGAHLYLPSTVLDTLKVSDISSFSNVEMLLRILVVLPFSRRESTFRQGRRALQEFMQQSHRKLSELHPL